jgi:threonine/homoserine/homoserine lactone efflux protein
LPYAVGVAISPVAIASVLLLLTCRRPVATGTSFAVGWTASIAMLSAALAVLVRTTDVTNQHPAWVAVLELMLGSAFLVATATLVGRRERREARSVSVLTTVDTLTPAHAAGLGVVLSAANPKVLALALGAAVTLTGASASTATTAEAVLLFTTVGAAGVAVPLAFYVAFPSRSRSMLGRTRAALVRHETVVLILLGLAIGALFLVDGLRSLG